MGNDAAVIFSVTASGCKCGTLLDRVIDDKTLVLQCLSYDRCNAHAGGDVRGIFGHRSEAGGLPGTSTWFSVSQDNWLERTIHSLGTPSELGLSPVAILRFKRNDTNRRGISHHGKASSLTSPPVVAKIIGSTCQAHLKFVKLQEQRVGCGHQSRKVDICVSRGVQHVRFQE